MKNKKTILTLFLVFIITVTLAFSFEINSKEKSHIKTIKPLVVGVANNMTPLEYHGVGYKHQGIIADFLNEILLKLDTSVEYKTGSQEELLEMLLNNKIDILAHASYDKKPNLFFLTEAFFVVDNSLFVQRNKNGVESLDKLSHSVIGIQKESMLQTHLRAKYPDIKIRYFDSSKEAFNLLLSGEIEGFIGSTLIGNHTIDLEGIKDRVKQIHVQWLRSPLGFAISKKRPKVYKVFQKAVRNIDHKTYNNITKKWLDYTNDYRKVPLYFTKEEIEWIKNNPDIIVGASKEWKPLSYFENGALNGVSSGFLKKISQKTGLNFIPKKYELFPNLLNGMKHKEIDMIDAVVSTEERALYMDFSNSYLSVENIIAINNTHKPIHNVKELNGKKVGIIKGYVVGKHLKNSVPNINIVTFDKIEEGLRALSDKKLDAFVIDLPIFDYYTAKLRISNLIVSAKTPYEFSIKFGVKKDEKILLSILNKALNSISESEFIQIYRQWVSVKFVQKIDYTLVWKIVAIFGFFILGTLYWNRKLSNEIKKRKKIEKELIIAKKTAEDATQAKSIFLANMSHEIRTPMNSVIGFADLLGECISDPVQKGYLNSIQVGGKALLGIINDILDLSKIEAGQLNVIKESVNVYNLFLEMQQFFNDKITQKNLTFDIHIDKTIPKYLILDGVRLRQILINLIGNAIKFTEKGGIRLEVEKKFKDSNGSTLDLIFKVEDSGIGIPKSAQDNIFKAFVQKKKQSVKKYGGTGLGLSICKSLVDIMNGKMKLESEVGKGTTFTVVLKDVEVSTLIEEEESEKKDNIEFQPATILVVDDVEENRDLVKAIFADTPILVQEAKDGNEAIEIVTKGNIALILMDLQMPELNGYEATNILRQTYSTKKLPIIALTASIMGDDLNKVKEFGFNGYLRKPTYKKAIINELMNFLPYNSNKKQESKSSGVIFETQTIKETITKKLSQELYQEWKNIKDKGDIELVRDFNAKIKKLLKYQNLDAIKHYTENLSVCIDGFDLVEMYNLLNVYPKLLKELEEGSVKNV